MRPRPFCAHLDDYHHVMRGINEAILQVIYCVDLDYLFTQEQELAVIEVKVNLLIQVLHFNILH